MKKKQNNFLKRNSVKIVGGGCILLTLLSIFSIGFSSWTIVSNPKYLIDINASVEDIAEPKDIINITSSSADFSIGPDGMVKDSTIVNAGSLFFSFSIINENANGFISSDGYIHARVTLKCSNPKFISYVENKPSGDGLLVGNNTSPQSAAYINEISFSLKDGDTTKFDLKYKVVDNEGGIKKFYSNVPSLSCSAKLITTGA